MKKILVPTDFSSSATNALNFAVQTAKAYPLEIILLHVVDRMDSLYSETPELIQENYTTVLEEAQIKLDQVKTSIADTELVEIRTFLREGEVEDHILELSEEKDIDLIVMGTFGINGLKDRIWGSKTAGLTGKTKVPVMVIPYEYNWKAPQKALLATSFFEEDSNVLNPVAELIAVYNLILHVAVFTDEDKADAAQFMENSMNIDHYGKKLQRKLNTMSVITSHLSGHKFEDALQDYIKDNDIDILVMVTYQRSNPIALQHKSCSEQCRFRIQ